MFCSHCGNNNSETAHFCIYCGASLEEEKKAEPVITQGEPVVEATAEPEEKEQPKKARRGLRGWHIALICVGATLLLILQSALIAGSATREEENPEKILYEAYQNHIGSGKTFEEYKEEQAAKENQQEQQDTEETYTPAIEGGAASLDELKSILSSDYLFSEKQVDCATTMMHLWFVVEEVDCEDGLKIVAERNIEKIQEGFNYYGHENKIIIEEIVECNAVESYSYISTLSDAVSLVEEECYGDLSDTDKILVNNIATTLLEESKKIEGIWCASLRWYDEEFGWQFIPAEESGFLIYKINGRYYWSCIEIY